VSTLLEVGVAGLAVCQPDQGTRPQPSILPPNERRRAPDTVVIALEVAHAACVNAGRDPAQLPAVFASTYGDLAITDYMCSTLASAPLTLSPTRFHNSVHNAAAGYWSIATGCRQSYCALGAGRYTFAAGLFAAALQACADQTDVLLVAYDIEARGPLVRIAPSRGILGVALVLSAAPDSAATGLELTVTEGGSARHPDAGSGNGMAASLPLVAALEAQAPAFLSLPLGPHSCLAVRVRPP
jgi:hypothetical protein